VVRRDGTIRWVHALARRASSPETDPQVWNGLMIDVTEHHVGDAVGTQRVDGAAAS